MGILKEWLHNRATVKGVVSPASAVHEQLPELSRSAPGYLSLIQTADKGDWGKPGRKFLDLRAVSMTINERIRVASLHQNDRNLSRSARSSAPHRTKSKIKICWEKAGIRRSSHGIARVLEDLRRVRLSLVPCPEPGERVLQGV